MASSAFAMETEEVSACALSPLQTDAPQPISGKEDDWFDEEFHDAVILLCITQKRPRGHFRKIVEVREG